MKTYLITIEVRVGVEALDEATAKQDAQVSILDAATAERLHVEWLGQDVVSCEEL